MFEKMITYNDIYESLRKEKYSEQLQPIAKNYVAEVAAYLKEKKSVSDKSEDMFSEAISKTKKQFENAVSMFNELMLRRKKKLLNLSFVAAETGLSKRDYENMLAVEKEIFDAIMKSMEIGDKKMMGLLNGQEATEEKKNKLISFLQDTEEFVGLDGDKLGPFKKGDIVNLQSEIADILIADNKAEVMQEEE
jgi:DNA replication initiation complex subunit (GINS family)